MLKLYSPSTFNQREICVHLICPVDRHVQLCGRKVKTNNWGRKTKRINLQNQNVTVSSTDHVSPRSCTLIIFTAAPIRTDRFLSTNILRPLPHFPGFQFNLRRALHTSGCLSRSDRVRPCCRISWRACGRTSRERRDRMWRPRSETKKKETAE